MKKLPGVMNSDDLLALIQARDPSFTLPTKQHTVINIHQNTELNLIKPISYGDLINMQPEPVEYVIHPILPTQGIAIIYAASGVGKTLVTLNLAYAIAGGGDFIKYSCPVPRKTLYVDGEMSFKEIHQRITDISNSQGKLENIDNFTILTPDKLLPHRVPKIDEKEGQQFYTNLLQQDQYEVVVFDNLSMLSSLDECDSSAWKIIQDWFLFLRSLGKTVILVHHAGKDKTGYRGTSRMLDCVNVAISLQSLDEDNEENADIKRIKIDYQKKRGFSGKDALPFEIIYAKGKWTHRTMELTDLQRVVEGINSNMTQREVAKEMNCSQKKVFSLIQKAKKCKLLL